MKNPFENFQNLGTVKSDLEEYQHPGEEDAKDILEKPEEKPSFSIFYFASFFVVLILVFRLLDLQIVQGAQNQYLAEGNRIRERNLPAPRGNIYDKDGAVLAKNTPSFSLQLYPADLPKDKAEREKVYVKIDQFSQIPQDELKSKVEKVGLYSLDPIVLVENLQRDQALILQVKYKDISGVVVSKNPTRIYNSIPGMAHILGYIGKIGEDELKNNPDYKITDNFGKSGIELSYENLLKGQDGKEQVEVDSIGRIQRILATLEPKSGNNLYLTIDKKLQEEIAKDLKETLDNIKLSKAVAVAMDPRDGSILGMVNFPSFDSNIFNQANFNEEYQKLLTDDTQPMLNRALLGVYPSGSIIKPVIASAALQENVVSENTTINDPGEIKIGEWTFPDWKNHGKVDIRKALAESCDVFFYSIGGGWDKIAGLGVNRLKNYLEKFGFGAKTGIDLPSESAGLIPGPDWKKKNKKEPWYIGDTYHLAIGQGDLLITPLQMAKAISAIANGGQLLKPHLLDKVVDQQGKTIKEIGKVVESENFIDQGNLQIVREGMRQCVTDGSCRLMNDLPVSSAGKTGTAQFANNEKTHAWFVSFAPYENPEIVLVVLVEGGGEGNEIAEPVAKKILQYYFNK